MELKDLLKPFPESDIEWRVQSSGEKNGKVWALVLAYISNRAIMERLDNVCAPQNWKNYFEKAPEGGILCGISIKCGDEWVTKWDGAENTQIEAIKGGLSGAMKRAGNQWGIGRYLYKLPAGWAQISDKGEYSAKTKENKWFKWDPPSLPQWALPEGAKQKTKKKTTPKKEVEPPPKKLTLNEWLDQAKSYSGLGGNIREWYKDNQAEIKTHLSEDEMAALIEFCAELAD